MSRITKRLYSNLPPIYWSRLRAVEKALCDLRYTQDLDARGLTTADYMKGVHLPGRAALADVTQPLRRVQWAEGPKTEAERQPVGSLKANVDLPPPLL